jgi:hypothetical protein
MSHSINKLIQPSPNGWQRVARTSVDVVLQEQVTAVAQSTKWWQYVAGTYADAILYEEVN